MLLRTEGIVLSTVRYGDADLIVTWLTHDSGIRKGFARSARKTRSRFGSSLEPLTHTQISLMGKEASELPRLTQSDIIDSFHKLRENIDLLTILADPIHLIQKILPEGEPHPRKFDLLLAALRALEADGPPTTIVPAFTIKLLWMAGYGPRTDECGRCGAAVPPDRLRLFYPAHGTVLCKDCRPGETEAAVRIGPEAAALFTRAKGARFTDLMGFCPAGSVLREVREVLSLHGGHLTGRVPRHRGTSSP